MTETEWAQCTDLYKMIKVLGSRKSPWKWSTRKARLFACACCRRVWDLLTDPGNQSAVEVAERAAEKRATQNDLRIAQANSAPAILGRNPDEIAAPVGSWKSEAKWNFWVRCDPKGKYSCIPGAAAADPKPWGDPHETANACRAMLYFRKSPAAADQEKQLQCDLLREVVGLTPAPALKAGRLTRTITSLAQAAFEYRDLPSGHLEADRVVILADALEESGCGSRDPLLVHLRQPQAHVRGCWAVDLLSGKR